VGRRRVLAAALLAASVTVVGCTGDDGAARPDDAAQGTHTPVSSTPAEPASGLRDTSTCRPRFTCGDLEVPLDRTDPDGRTMPVRVAVESDPQADRGLLVVLAGGPGQAGLPLLPRFVRSLGRQVLATYRIAVLDQRGTGARALRCDGLQSAMGFSDLTPPPASAVRDCAARLGDDREFYSTDDVVADLDQLRAALGSDRMTLYGTSYGTFVAEQYALRYPRRTQALVLDSVVPHDGVDPLATDVMQAVRRVLRDACSTGCSSDPVDDAAAVVAAEGNGVELLDLAVMMSIVDPTFEPLLEALDSAADGSKGQLDALLQGYREGFQGSARQLSQGLHASALCSDWRFPWGTSEAPLAGREAAVDGAVAELVATDLVPFDRDTARGNGFVRQCLPWPPVPAAPLAQGDLPDVPTLLLAGTHDLSTPLEWAQREARHAPDGRLVVVPGAGHGVVGHGGRGVAALREFLLQ
jgi:pimeloyl-ACP methyl ester carboxylesterase